MGHEGTFDGLKPAAAIDFALEKRESQASRKELGAVPGLFLEKIEKNGFDTPIARMLKELGLSPEQQADLDGAVFSRIEPGLLQFIEGTDEAERIIAKIKTLFAMPTYLENGRLLNPERARLAKEIIADIERASE